MITSTELNTRPDRRSGYLCTARFDDSETGQSITKTFRFSANPTVQEKQDKFTSARARFAFKVNPLNDINVEGLPNLYENIKQLVQYIRNNPDCTKPQLMSVIETAWQDINWKAIKLVEFIREKAGVTTFDEFKLFVINKKFGSVDG